MTNIVDFHSHGLTPEDQLGRLMERFATVVASWNLTEAETDAILFAPEGAWASFHPSPGGRLPLPHCERRVDMIIEIDRLLASLLTCGAAPVDWLRRFRGTDRGLTPIGGMSRNIGVLPAMLLMLRRAFDEAEGEIHMSGPEATR